MTPKARALQIVYDQLVNPQPTTPQEKLELAIKKREEEEFRQWFKQRPISEMTAIYLEILKGGKSFVEIRAEFDA